MPYQIIKKIPAITGLISSILVGCASSSTPVKPYLDQGHVLSEAGFVAHPGNTTARYAMMNTLPPGQLTYRPSPEGLVFLYADPKGCGCVYMGSSDAYAKLRQISQTQYAALKKPKEYRPSVQNEMAAMTAENRRDTTMWDWSAWYTNADPVGNQPRGVIGAYW